MCQIVEGKACLDQKDKEMEVSVDRVGKYGQEGMN